MKERLILKYIFINNIYENDVDIFGEPIYQTMYQALKTFYITKKKKPTKIDLVELHFNIETTTYLLVDFSSEEYEIAEEKYEKTINEYELRNKYLEDLRKNDSIESEDEIDETKNILKGTKIFGDEVHKNIPRILKQAIDLESEDRLKDVLLLSQITTLSSIFKNYKTWYWNDYIQANLYAFIVAPAASGKSKLKDGYNLISKIEDKLMYDNQQKKINYELALKNKQTPTEPIYERISIGGDSSTAALYKNLQNNSCLIYESEADIVIQNKKNNWGDNSTVLRNSFQHEKLNPERKDETIIVKRPKLSILVSGTPDQPKSLIETTQNGLFSRFMFYAFASELKFTSPHKKKSMINKTLSIKKHISSEVFDLWEATKDIELEFSFTNKQSKDFEIFFQDKLITLSEIYGEGTADFVIRLGMIFQRISMILQLLEDYTNTQPTYLRPQILVCSDVIYETTKKIVEVLLQHTTLLFYNLDSNKTIFKQNDLDVIFNELQNVFEKKDFVEIASKKKISYKKVSTYLNKMKKLGKVEQQMKGGRIWEKK